MKEYDIITQFRDEILSVTPSGTDVRTDGGDEQITFPEVVIDWSAGRISDHGANPFSHFNYDTNGNVIARVKHHYFGATVTLEFKSQGEAQIYDLTDTVQRHFMQYEDRSNDFHPHTYLWEVGDVRPQHNPVAEPDWYESALDVEFRFLKVVTDTNVTALTDIQYNINSTN